MNGTSLISPLLIDSMRRTTTNYPSTLAISLNCLMMLLLRYHSRIWELQPMPMHTTSTRSRCTSNSRLSLKYKGTEQARMRASCRRDHLNRSLGAFRLHGQPFELCPHDLDAADRTAKDTFIK